MASVQPQTKTPASQALGTRTLHLTNPLLEGPDVEELQKLLKPYHPGKVDREYGPATADAVKLAKWTLGYPDAQCDTSAGPRLIAYLKGAPVPADFQARMAARRHDAAKALTVREQIVAIGRWGIENEPQIHYQQSRPIDGLHEVRKLPLRTDCSGFLTLCYAWAGAPDPNGLGYSGQGYTGTLLSAMRRIPQSAAQPGDIVVWGDAPGNHAALVLESGGDPLLSSHGQEKGPLAIRFSVESQYQQKPVVWLSCLP